MPLENAFLFAPIAAVGWHVFSRRSAAQPDPGASRDSGTDNQPVARVAAPSRLGASSLNLAGAAQQRSRLFSHFTVAEHCTARRDQNWPRCVALLVGDR